MKKLILILVLVLVCLLAIACLPKQQVDGPIPSTGPQSTTSVTPPATTQPRPEGWYETADGLYYYEDGQPVSGWRELDGLHRFFLPDGRLAQGFAEADGTRYYFDENGCITTGWVDVDGKRYYLGDSGAVHTGWLEEDGVLYYFRESGAMARGCVEIEGVKHYFTSTGANILVLNPWNSLPEDYQPELVKLSSHYAVENRRVDRSCYDALIEMMDACNQVCPRVCVLSGYRSVEAQTKNYNSKVNSLIQQGYSRPEAERLAAQEVAVPGTSEHHSGLAVDIIDTRLWALDERQAELPAQKWLMEHSWEYGFILRYPKDKLDVTGIIYEPWHYRYVGKALAKELHELQLTLEEYLDMLTEQEKAA